MRICRDSFLHFINDNLPDGVICHPLRRDPLNRTADALAMNAVNVSFLNVAGGNGTAFCTQQAVIDVINDDENAAVDLVDTLFALLTATFYAPLSDYTVPTAPVATGKFLMWNRRRVTFKKVASEAYCHYTCLLLLQFTSS